MELNRHEGPVSRVARFNGFRIELTHYPRECMSEIPAEIHGELIRCGAYGAVAVALVVSCPKPKPRGTDPNSDAAA